MARGWIKLSFRRQRAHPFPAQVKYLALAVGGLCLLIGGFLLYAIGVDYRRAKQSQTWPKETGVLLACNTNQWPRSGVMRVKYEYKFGGHTFPGDTICFGVQSARKFLLSPIKTPTPIEVFVNPNLPAQSVLFPGLAPGDYGASVTGAFLLLIGVLIVIQLKHVVRVMTVPKGRPPKPASPTNSGQ
jgi:Protein of unknown function (DUF3592)